MRYQAKEGQRDQLSMLSSEDKQLLDSILASGTIAIEGSSISRSFNRMDQWSMIIQEKVMKADIITKNNNNKMMMMMDKSDSVDDATSSTVAKEEEEVVVAVVSTLSSSLSSDASKSIVADEDGVQKEAINDAIPLVNVNALSTVLETKEEDDNDDDVDDDDDDGDGGGGKVDRRRDDTDRRDDSDRRDGVEKEEVEVEYIYQPKVVHNIKLSRFYDEMKEKREKELTYIYRDEKIAVEFPIEAAMMEEDLIDAEGSQAMVQRFSYHGFRDMSKRAAINVPSRNNSSSSSSSTSQREGESMLQLLRMQGGVSSSSLALGSTNDTVDGSSSGSDRSVLLAYRHLAKRSPAKSQQIYYSQDLDDDDNDDDDDDDNEDYSVDYTVNDAAAAAEDKNYGHERARYNHQHHRVVSDQVDDDDDPFM